MGFKSVKSYNETKFGNVFRLVNDGDHADVIFMYESDDDIMVVDCHYIKSSDFSGYVQCTGSGCPACGKGIRTQTKLFVPMYNLTTDQLEFWDRTMQFEPQLMQDVFKRYPNPSEYVFRITRHGVYRDVNTTYTIEPIARNSSNPFSVICANNHVTFPEYYNTICKDMTNDQIFSLLNQSGTPTPNNEYVPIPRTSAQVDLSEVAAQLSDYSVVAPAQDSAVPDSSKFDEISAGSDPDEDVDF